MDVIREEVKGSKAVVIDGETKEAIELVAQLLQTESIRLQRVADLMKNAAALMNCFQNSPLTFYSGVSVL